MKARPFPTAVLFCVSAVTVRIVLDDCSRQSAKYPQYLAWQGGHVRDTAVTAEQRERIGKQNELG